MRPPGHKPGKSYRLKGYTMKTNTATNTAPAYMIAQLRDSSEGCAWRVKNGYITHASWLPTIKGVKLCDFAGPNMGKCEPPIQIAQCMADGWTIIKTLQTA